MQPFLKWKSNTYYTFWVCLQSWLSSTQRACTVLYCHLWPVSTIFPHYLTNCTIFGGKRKLLHKKSVFGVPLHLLLKTFLILRRIQQHTINVHSTSYKVSTTLVRCSWKLDLLDKFSKNSQIPNFMKIRPMRTVLFHANGLTCQS